MSTSFDFTANINCQDFFVGQAAGGFAYDVGFGTPNRARFRIQCAVPFDNRGPIDDFTETYAFKASFLRSKTTGTGACTGCTASACIVLNEIQLFQPPDANFDPIISNPISRQYVTFQLPPTGPPGCPQSTPVRSKTWGQVKSLYR